MTSARRTLLLLRHATAEPGRPGGPDAERRLTEVGRLEAAGVGDFLRSSGLRVDHVLCSPAVRTRETLDQLRLTAGGADLTVELVPRLYAATAEEIVELLGALSATTVLVVGHAPGVPAAVDLLAGPGSSAGAAAAVARRYPPGTLARLDSVEGRGSGSGSGALSPGRGVLVGVRLPEQDGGRYFG